MDASEYAFCGTYPLKTEHSRIKLPDTIVHTILRRNAFASCLMASACKAENLDYIVLSDSHSRGLPEKRFELEKLPLEWRCLTLSPRIIKLLGARNLKLIGCKDYLELWNSFALDAWDAYLKENTSPEKTREILAILNA
jgi:hypothetical protein